MSQTFLIAGAGIAGTEAAAAARATDPTSRIVVAAGEPGTTYSRIRLPEVVDGRALPERIVIRSESWFRDRAIELLPDCPVVSIDPAAGRGRLADGREIPFDGLVLAIGARSFLPPIPGCGLAGVRTVRTLQDALALRAAALDGGLVVVVGGGLLGLEMAAALAGMGLVVTVLESSSRLLPRQLDPEGAAVVQGLLAARGLQFRLGARVSAFAGEDRVREVVLADGERLEARIVLVAAGVVPDVSLAREAGLAIGRGIRVDDRLATSAPGVFAAGDCAEHRGIAYGIWPAAEAQGRVAGAAMAGADVRYTGTVRSNTLKVTGIPVFSIGDFDPDGRRAVMTSHGEGTYRRIVRDGDRIIGAVLVGDVSERRRLMAEIGG